MEVASEQGKVCADGGAAKGGGQATLLKEAARLGACWCEVMVEHVDLDLRDVGVWVFDERRGR